MKPGLKVEVFAKRGRLIFVDPDGDRHACSTPEEVWDLLEDLAVQVEEQAGLVVVEQPKGAKAGPAGAPKSRAQRVREERAQKKRDRAKARSSSADGAMAKVEAQEVSTAADAPQPGATRAAADDTPEEHDPFARGFAHVAHAVIRKTGDISKSSKWGRGGRFSRPKGT